MLSATAGPAEERRPRLPFTLAFRLRVVNLGIQSWPDVLLDFDGESVGRVRQRIPAGEDSANSSSDLEWHLLRWSSAAPAVATGPGLAKGTPPTRVRAAEVIINNAAKAIEIEDIDARVTELERAAESQRPGGPK
jgi:hypothetical protein